MFAELERDIGHLERTRSPSGRRWWREKGSGSSTRRCMTSSTRRVAGGRSRLRRGRRRLTGRALALSAGARLAGGGRGRQGSPRRRASWQPSRARCGTGTRQPLPAGDGARKIPRAGGERHGDSCRLRAGALPHRAGPSGDRQEASAGLAALKQYAQADPGDPRTKKLLETGAGAAPSLRHPRPPRRASWSSPPPREHTTLHSRTYGFDVSWPRSAGGWWAKPRRQRRG